LHGFQNVFEKLDARVRKGDPFEVDKLTLLKFDIDDRTLVTHNDDLCVLIFLLDC
jgi:hypothetical protein